MATEQLRSSAWRKEVKIGDRVVSYAILRADESVQQPRTVLLVPGIVTKLNGMLPLAAALNTCGYHTVTMAHETVDRGCALDVAVMADIARTERELSASTALYIAAHSLGAIHTIHALGRYSTTQRIVDGVALLAPVGYRGVHPERAVQSVLTEAMRRPDTRQVRAVVLDALSYTARAGVHLLGKIRSTSDVSLIDETATLLDAGIRIGAVRYPKDLLVAPDEMGRGLAEAGLEYVFDVQAPHAGHNAHILHPAEVADSVNSLVRSLHDGYYEQRGATRLGE